MVSTAPRRCGSRQAQASATVSSLEVGTVTEPLASQLSVGEDIRCGGGRVQAWVA